MHLGIKIGPENWQAKLDGTGIQAAEVYFDLRRAAEYPAMFAWLRERGVQAGLHASTPLDGGVFPNLVTADKRVRQPSLDLFRRTIDAAGQAGLRFVVFHPGSYRDLCIRQGRVILLSQATGQAEGWQRLSEGMASLAAYGQAQGVEVWAENLPGREFAAYGPVDRQRSLDPGFLPYSVLRALGEQGIGLCLDLGHLYAEAIAGGIDGDRAFDRVMAITRELVPYARHLHLSTVIPPWNGTDSHNGFLDADYALGAVPSRDDLVAWLGLFAGRDLWVIPEPDGDAPVHLENYRRLRAWMEQLP